MALGSQRGFRAGALNRMLSVRLMKISVSLAICAAAGIGCSHGQILPPNAESFARFVDEYFEAEFAFRPTLATLAGFHQYDPQLEDFSKERTDARIAELKQLQARLAAFDLSKLSFDDSIDAELLQGDIRGKLLDLETLRLREINPMPYAQAPGAALDSLMKRNFAPAADRLRSVISRLKAIPAIYAAARSNLKNPPKEFTDLALRSSRNSVHFLKASVAGWARDAASGSAALANDFDAANRDAIAATEQFAAWLQSDLLPRSNGSYAIGAANFRAKLKYEEMVDLPLQELLAKGEGQLAKDYAAFLETARKVNPSQPAGAVMKSLSNQHPTAEELIPSVARSLEEARRFVVEKQIVTIPSDVRPRVEEMPPYARIGSFASMNTPGPYETKATEAFYYVTPVEKDWDAQHQEQHLRLYNPFVVAMINVHEAYPGHYLQFLYAPIFPTKARKLLHRGSNAEGWAHYAEQMMVDQGFGGGDPRIRLAQLQEALLRDCRYVVGIKLHTEGMTVEEGKQIFVEKGFQEPANAFEEARRGTYNPTYLYYTLGKLQIQELREEFKAKRGGNLRSFHDAFVAQGALPIALLRRTLFR